MYAAAHAVAAGGPYDGGVPQFARVLLALGATLALAGCALLLPPRLAVAPTARVIDLAVGTSTTFTVTNAGAAGSVLRWSFVGDELEAWPASGSLLAGDYETVLVLAPSAAQGRTLAGRFVAPRQEVEVSVAVVRGPALTCDPDAAFAAAGVDAARVLVGYRAGVARSAAARTAAASDVALLAHAVGGQRLRVGAAGEHDLLEVPTAAAAGLVRALKARADVAYAELDRPVARAAVGPDPRFGQQWNLTGFGAAEAWSVTDAAPAPADPVVVAVVDDGVAVDHPDLAAVLLPGYDVVHGDADPRNCTDHGTHVAGIVGAVRENAEGIAGVASQPDAPWVRLLPVKAWPDSSDPSSTTQIDPIARAIRWSAGLEVAGLPENPFPADVINLSLGALRTFSPTLAAAIADAQALGAVVVAAAGNGGVSDGVDYPARSGAIAVGSVDDDFGRSSFSNHGAGLTLVAPGGYGPDLACSAVVSTGLAYADGVATETYTCKAGTSMATPYVAGAVALLIGTDASLPEGAARHDAVDARLRTAAEQRPGANPEEYGAGVLCLDALLTTTHVCGEPVLR